MKLTYKRFEPLPPYSGFKSRIKERQRYESPSYHKNCFQSGMAYYATKFLDRFPLLDWLQLDGQKPRFALRQKIL